MISQIVVVCTRRTSPEGLLADVEVDAIDA
jgi:hypothetical protein